METQRKTFLAVLFPQNSSGGPLNLRSIILHALIITIAVTAVYANTFGTPFRYDSTDSITENPSIRDLSYFLDKEKQPKESKNIFKTRYVGFLTLALNYRVHG
ncbi:MAG: hypothetical protein GWN61_00975, partial [candidate division Zixibacteria bacterium]|nr:hypothetical protein [candidate division Zixibacteria bacterium]NIR62489.1 hypothetical protein [candidate division Zixibacteria bacterium]NIS44629.1 hypothetical protein [candidate division Zixibacteria bacterium]NIU12683.1 hypothetical protein [candidate division Zixibacteria bacterium]NIV04798.1 hypothetical protein [candidate division Zixibacteria bacterium]